MIPLQGQHFHKDFAWVGHWRSLHSLDNTDDNRDSDSGSGQVSTVGDKTQNRRTSNGHLRLTSKGKGLFLWGGWKELGSFSGFLWHSGHCHP